MSSTDTPSTTTSDSSPKFPSKEWFLKNKVLVGIVVIVVLLGTGVGIYFAVRPKSGTAGGGGSGGGSGGSTDTGARKNGKWSDWSAECVKQGDQWVKTRTCLEEGRNGGLLCSQIDGGKTTQICEAIPGGWRTPDDSDAVCKLEDGKWVKERFCDAPAPKYGGAACSGPNKVECTPVAGGWRTPADSDAVCKLEDGKWVKERFCDAPAPKYGATCSGSNKVECTPQNGRWKTNFSDEICKVETDAQQKPIVDSAGRTTYYKTIICEEPKYGGAPCPTRTETGVDVSGGKARIKCQRNDGVWAQFSDCNLEGNNSVKTRTCTLPQYGGLPCVADYPLVNLVENDDSGYIVSASSEHTADAWKACRAFDGNIQSCWHSNVMTNSNLYDAFDGTYKGTILTTVDNKTTYRGEWIQIRFPLSTIHTSFQAIGIKITPRQDSDAWARRSPRNFVLLGSLGGSSWTVIYDNTLLDGIKDWTQSAKTIYFPTPASRGYIFYRLVVTRVGNDCPSQQPCDRNSVQIAELRIIGTPFVTPNSDSTNPLQTTEKIPCDTDCRLSDWQPACVKEGNDWKQNRTVSVQPVGTGKACSTDLKRNCPGTATNWSAWGAFKVNNVYQKTGNPSQFSSSNDAYYLENSVYKQVAYVVLGDNQGCPSDSTSYDATSRTCFKYRNVFGDYGECHLVNGSWKKARTNNITGLPDYTDCTPDSNWQYFPQGKFKIKIKDQNLHLGYGPRRSVGGRPYNRGSSRWAVTVNTDGGQVFSRGVGSTTDPRDKYLYVSPWNNNNFTDVVSAWGNDNTGQVLFLDGIPTDVGTNDGLFSYDNNTGMISPNTNTQTPGRLCLHVEDFVDNRLVYTRACNPSEAKQRFEIKPF
jgi:hypothetical protein